MQIVSVIVVLGLGQVVHPDIVHRWAADGDATDSVGDADGIMSGAVGYSLGVFGQAFDFSGGEVNFGATAGNFGSSDFTVAFWFRTYSTENQALLSKRDICMISTFWELRLYAHEPPPIGLAAVFDGTNNAFLESTASYNDSLWHHCALTRDGLIVQLFMDGFVVAEDSTSAVIHMLNEADTIAGTSICEPTPPAGTPPLDGQIDEIQIYHRALAVGEIEHLATGLCPADFNGDRYVGAEDLAVLLGFWGMDDPLFGDLNGDGIVDAADLAQLLGSWGPCV